MAILDEQLARELRLVVAVESACDPDWLVIAQRLLDDTEPVSPLPSPPSSPPTPGRDASVQASVMRRVPILDVADADSQTEWDLQTESVGRRIGLRPEARAFVPDPVGLLRRELACWVGFFMQRGDVAVSPRRSGGRQRRLSRLRNRRSLGCSAPAFVGEQDAMDRFISSAASAGWLG